MYTSIYADKYPEGYSRRQKTNKQTKQKQTKQKQTNKQTNKQTLSKLAFGQNPKRYATFFLSFFFFFF